MTDILPFQVGNTLNVYCTIKISDAAADLLIFSITGYYHGNEHTQQEHAWGYKIIAAHTYTGTSQFSRKVLYVILTGV